VGKQDRPFDTFGRLSAGKLRASMKLIIVILSPAARLDKLF